jgi:hypothetical protein
MAATATASTVPLGQQHTPHLQKHHDNIVFLVLLPFTLSPSAHILTTAYLGQMQNLPTMAGELQKALVDKHVSLSIRPLQLDFFLAHLFSNRTSHCLFSPSPPPSLNMTAVLTGQSQPHSSDYCYSVLNTPNLPLAHRILQSSIASLVNSNHISGMSTYPRLQLTTDLRSMALLYLFSHRFIYHCI